MDRHKIYSPEYTKSQLKDYKQLLIEINENACPTGVLPEDVLVRILSFTEMADMISAASVSIAMRNVSYNPSLWSELNLYRYQYRVNDDLLKHLFSTSKRFLLIESLVLDNCRMVTAKGLKVVAKHCRGLKRISLIRCNKISVRALQKLPARIPRLESMEIYMTKAKTVDVIEIAAKYKYLDMGVYAHKIAIFLKKSLKCGEEKSPENSKTMSLSDLLKTRAGNPADNKKPSFYLFYDQECAFAGDFNMGACFGVLKGVVVMSDEVYQTAGNFPDEVVYFCQNHKEMLTNKGVTRCEYCFNYIEKQSMHNEIVCRSCKDRISLNQEENWIKLDKKTNSNISPFVFFNTIRVANQKNIPNFLKRAGSVDIRLREPPDAAGDEEGGGLKSFCELNEPQFSEGVAAVKAVLAEGEDDGEMAVLVFDENGQVGVYTASGAINGCINLKEFIGIRSLLENFWMVFYPIILIMILCGLLSSLKEKVTEELRELFSTMWLRIYFLSAFPAIISIVIISLIISVSCCRTNNNARKLLSYVSTVCFSFILVALMMAGLYAILASCGLAVSLVHFALFFANLFFGFVVFTKNVTAWYNGNALLRGVLFVALFSFMFSLLFEIVAILAIAIVATELLILALGLDRSKFDVLEINMNYKKDPFHYFKIRYENISIGIVNLTCFGVVIVWLSNSFMTSSATVLGAFSTIITSYFAIPLFNVKLRAGLMLTIALLLGLPICFSMWTRVDSYIESSNNFYLFMP